MHTHANTHTQTHTHTYIYKCIMYVTTALACLCIEPMLISESWQIRKLCDCWLASMLVCRIEEEDIKWVSNRSVNGKRKRVKSVLLTSLKQTWRRATWRQRQLRQIELALTDWDGCHDRHHKLKLSKWKMVRKNT